MTKIPKIREPRKPSDTSLRLLKTAKQDVLNSDIVKNNWAYNYINSTSDLHRYAHDLDFLVQYVPKNSTVCEHGAAPFILSTAMAIAGYEVIATDLTPERFGNLDKLPFRSLKYDVNNPTGIALNSKLNAIIFNELIEHCRINLIATVMDLYNTLEPGGYLFLSTPNLKSAGGIFKYVKDDTSYAFAGDLYHEWSKIERIGHMGHVREYSPAELSGFLIKCGFNICTIVYRGSYDKRDILRLTANIISNIDKKLLPRFTIIAQKPFSS